MQDFFRQTARRRVAKDRTISLNGKLFEAPVALIGREQVTLCYHEAELERVEVFAGHQSYGFLAPVNLQVNSRVKRDKDSRLVLETSAESAYQGGALWERTNQPTTAPDRTLLSACPGNPSVPILKP